MAPSKKKKTCVSSSNSSSESDSDSSSYSSDTSSARNSRSRRIHTPKEKCRKRKSRSSSAKSQKKRHVSRGSAGASTSSFSTLNPLTQTNLTTIIPEFNPISDTITKWLEVIDHTATIYGWNESTTTFQALNKLKGTAQIWYDTIVRSEIGWSQYSWEYWKQLLTKTFSTQRNMYQLLVDLINHRPKSGDCLYEYFFKQLAKIENLNINFNESDKISLILGGINDNNITSSVEAANIKDLNVLSNYLRNKKYCVTYSHNPVATVNDAIPGTSKEGGNKHDFKRLNKQTFHKQKPINTTCFNCGLSHPRGNDCPAKLKICRFCGVQGHLEKMCFKKKRSDERVEKSLPKYDKREVHLINSVKAKFLKSILINNQCCKAFVDLGSDCSII